MQFTYFGTVYTVPPWPASSLPVNAVCVRLAGGRAIFAEAGSMFLTLGGIWKTVEQLAGCLIVVGPPSSFTVTDDHLVETGTLSVTYTRDLVEYFRVESAELVPYPIGVFSLVLSPANGGPAPAVSTTCSCALLSPPCGVSLVAPILIS